jgi:transposase
VETVLEQAPYSGHVFVFRGKRGDLIKLLWWEGDGLCPFQKRLKRGRFIWPQAARECVTDMRTVIDAAGRDRLAAAAANVGTTSSRIS